ncbi:hypothetical protein QGN29_05495 [Temperatibacter marinus]|uniref:Uncharacterized protein n=1 Tax=Temperatibacter marinus TaxID=1456591 RepID=A0AA52EE79_9PROT|nr:hypothetical protein [Temperatibacter marinus]WND03827.1 hypothetical protein QGN29_05495 [Temperatibacter marinus]
MSNKMNIFYTILLVTFTLGVTPISYAKEFKTYDLTFGAPNRLNQKTLSITQKLITGFCTESKLSCQFLTIPSRRLMRAFEQGKIDIVMYQDHVQGPGRLITDHPFAATTLLAIVLTENYPDKVFDHKRKGLTLAWHRGDGLGSTIGFSGNHVELDTLEQGLRLLKARPIDAILDWNSELFALMSYDKLREQGLSAIPILEDVPLFPVMKATNDKTLFLQQLNDWYLDQHAKGLLKKLYEEIGYQDVYPFGKNWQKWIK